MIKERFIRLSGWALMLGAVTFSLGILGFEVGRALYFRLGVPDAVGEWVFHGGLILLAVGMLGLRARYGDEVGSLGKNALLVGAIGGALTLIGNIELFYQFFEEFWVVIWVGTLVLFSSLLLFGVLALRRKLLPRWNWLPLVAGLWFPVAVLIAVVGGDEYQRMAAVTVASALISAVSLVPLGYILQADTPREPAVA